jgi:hypothetical protein
LAADVTHYHNDKFLTIIDDDPNRFAIWKRIKDESCEQICGKILTEIPLLYKAIDIRVIFIKHSVGVPQLVDMVKVARK